MIYAEDPRVDAYIDSLPAWQQAICSQVRDLVHAADPDVAETIKYSDRPYFVLEGNVCALLAAKDHVNVFLYDGAIVPDPEGIITSGHESKTARTVAIREGKPINAPALSAMLEQIRLAGALLIEQSDGWLVGWRYLSAESIALILEDQGDAGKEVPELQAARRDRRGTTPLQAT